MLCAVLDCTAQAQRSRRAHACGARQGHRVATPLLDPRNGPAFDLLSGAAPLRAYVIVSTPRTGSTLLCRTLWDTGRAAAPKEYCNPMQLRDWTLRRRAVHPVRHVPRRALPLWERAQTAAQRTAHLRDVLAHRTAPDGVFGLKLQPDQWVRWFTDLDTLRRTLNDPVFIRLTRTDRAAQAHSFARAISTGQWAAHEQKSRLPLPVSQRWAQRELDRQESLLDALLGTPPVYELVSEALFDDVSETVRAVLRHLGLPADGPMPKPALRPQTATD